MRGSWDNTFDAYYGPESTAGMPNSLYRTAVPCRVVFQDDISQGEYPINSSIAWVTFPLPQLNTAVIVGTDDAHVLTNYRAADRLAIPSATATAWVAARPEYVVPTVGGPYCRVMLVAIPFPQPPVPPPPPPPPGASCSTALPFVVGVPQMATLPPSSSPVWWGPVSVVGGSTYYLSSNVMIAGGGPPACVEGSSCAGTVPRVLFLIHPGCWSFVAGVSDSVWLLFNNPSLSTVSYTFTLSNTPC